MIRSINRVRNALKMLLTHNPDADADGLEDHARPGACKPVLHPPGAVEQGSDQGERAHDSGVQIDDRHEDAIRTQTGEQRAALRRRFGRGLLLRRVHYALRVISPRRNSSLPRRSRSTRRKSGIVITAPPSPCHHCALPPCHHCAPQPCHHDNHKIVITRRASARRGICFSSAASKQRTFVTLVMTILWPP